MLTRFLTPQADSNGNTYIRLTNTSLINSYISPQNLEVTFGDVQNFAELQALWTSYKFKSLTFTWRLVNNLVNVSATSGVDIPIPRLHCCYNTSSQLPSSVSAMREFASYRVYNLFPGKQIKYRVKPHHAVNTYDSNASLIGYSPSTTYVYTQSDSVDVPWYGMVFAISDWPYRHPTDPENLSFAIDIDCRATMYLRNIH